MGDKDRVADGSFVWCSENKRFYLKMDGELYGITAPERNLRKLECKSCGASLAINPHSPSLVKCEYCGSVYDIDGMEYIW